MIKKTMLSLAILFSFSGVVAADIFPVITPAPGESLSPVGSSDYFQIYKYKIEGDRDPNSYGYYDSSETPTLTGIITRMRNGQPFGNPVHVGEYVQNWMNHDGTEFGWFALFDAPYGMFSHGDQVRFVGKVRFVYWKAYPFTWYYYRVVKEHQINTILTIP